MPLDISRTYAIKNLCPWINSNALPKLSSLCKMCQRDDNHSHMQHYPLDWLCQVLYLYAAGSSELTLVIG